MSWSDLERDEIEGTAVKIMPQKGKKFLYFCNV